MCHQIVIIRLTELAYSNLNHLFADTALGLLSSYSSNTPKSEKVSTPFNDNESQMDSSKRENASGSLPLEQPKLAGKAAMKAATDAGPPKSASLSPETEAVMEKLVAFVKVGFLAQRCQPFSCSLVHERAGQAYVAASAQPFARAALIGKGRMNAPLQICGDTYTYSRAYLMSIYCLHSQWSLCRNSTTVATSCPLFPQCCHI